MAFEDALKLAIKPSYYCKYCYCRQERAPQQCLNSKGECLLKVKLYLVFEGSISEKICIPARVKKETKIIILNVMRKIILLER